MSTTPTDSNRLPLAELIQQLRTEITTAMNQRETGAGKPQFELKEVELEVNFVVEKSQSLAGGIGGQLVLLALKADATTNYKTEQVHKVTLKLGAWTNAAPASESPFTRPMVKSRGNGSDGETIILFNEPEPTENKLKIRLSPGNFAKEFALDKLSLAQTNRHLKKYGVCMLPHAAVTKHKAFGDLKTYMP